MVFCTEMRNGNRSSTRLLVWRVESIKAVVELGLSSLTAMAILSAPLASKASSFILCIGWGCVNRVFLIFLLHPQL